MQACEHSAHSTNPVLYLLQIVDAHKLKICPYNTELSLVRQEPIHYSLLP